MSMNKLPTFYITSKCLIVCRWCQPTHGTTHIFRVWTNEISLSLACSPFETCWLPAIKKTHVRNVYSQFEFSGEEIRGDTCLMSSLMKRSEAVFQSVHFSMHAKTPGSEGYSGGGFSRVSEHLNATNSSFLHRTWVASLGGLLLGSITCRKSKTKSKKFEN